jgi:hypothetical protein
MQRFDNYYVYQCLRSYVQREANLKFSLIITMFSQVLQIPNQPLLDNYPHKFPRPFSSHAQIPQPQLREHLHSILQRRISTYSHWRSIHKRRQIHLQRLSPSFFPLIPSSRSSSSMPQHSNPHILLPPTNRHKFLEAKLELSLRNVALQDPSLRGRMRLHKHKPCVHKASIVEVFEFLCEEGVWECV